MKAYQALKKELVQDTHIISFLYQHTVPQIYLKEYDQYKRQHLESEAFLQFDRLIGNFTEFSTQVKEKHQMVLVTMRADQTRLTQQLMSFKLFHLFDRVITVSSQKGNPKLDVLKDLVESGDYMVGDSEIDIQCGQSLGLRTFHVDTGLRSYEFATKGCQAVRLDSYVDLIQYL